MAKGYPDYFGQSIWPKYGTMNALDATDAIASGADADIIDLSVQGQLSFLRIDFTMVADTLDVEIRLTIDDLVDLALSNAVFREIYTECHAQFPMVCPYYNTDEKEFSIVATMPIPFHNRFKVNVKNDGASDLGYQIIGGYYIIT